MLGVCVCCVCLRRVLAVCYCFGYARSARVCVSCALSVTCVSCECAFLCVSVVHVCVCCMCLSCVFVLCGCVCCVCAPVCCKVFFLFWYARSVLVACALVECIC